MILYIFIDVFCLQGIDGSRARLSCVYTNCKMLWSKGPHNGAYVVCLKCSQFILVSLSVLELQPGDQMRSNTWIALKSYHWSVFVPRLSWSDQQVLGKKNTPCVIIKNELALMSFCFVTRGCWNTCWQLALCKLNGNACFILYDHRDIKYQHGNYTK